VVVEVAQVEALVQVTEDVVLSGVAMVKDIIVQHKVVRVHHMVETLEVLEVDGEAVVLMLEAVEQMVLVEH
jgi:uncharacterized membrane protein